MNEPCRLCGHEPPHVVERYGAVKVLLEERDKAQADAEMWDGMIAKTFPALQEMAERHGIAVTACAWDTVPMLDAMITELKAEASSLRNETATANLSRLELQKLARRVVEIFEPMQAKGHGHTFELLLERAKKCLASYSGEPSTATAESAQ